ncbi:MAG: exopolysaccharide biosynthesis polyprenyl glycosylphosphotransferase [Oscillospiraceae bacterium]|nr:exopolysaccharide biosynthesis polyprenyl glycosylphosphotransferase [Oscillospiraceae bacterium]
MKKREKINYMDTKSFVQALESLLEVLVLTVMYYLVWRKVYQENGPFPDYYHKGKYVLMAVYGILLVIVFQGSDCFLFGRLRMSDIIIGQTIALLIVNFVTYFQLCLIANQMVSPLPILLLLALQVVAAAVLSIAYAWLYHKIYVPHNMLLIYGTKNAVTLKIKMDSRRDKYKIRRLISVDVGFDRICAEIPNYDAVILNDVPAQIRNDILKFCYQHSVRIYLAPKLTDIMVRGAKENVLFDTPLLQVRGNGLTLSQRILKRAMDIILCMAAMVAAAPVMLIIALAIKLEDGGPVFYRQKRLTLNGREFDILKFRSMIVDAEKNAGAVLATDNDPRITKVGKFIRATRLDEIPQILNILKGDMSIVGPRPERKCFVEEYAKEIPEFTYRMKVKGGLTGYAQVYGKYNTSAYDKLRLDLMYIENYSLLLDIKLIILTLRIIFRKDSTEGIDKAEDTLKRRDELLQELDEEQEQTPVGAGK